MTIIKPHRDIPNGYRQVDERDFVEFLKKNTSENKPDGFMDEIPKDAWFYCPKRKKYGVTRHSSGSIDYYDMHALSSRYTYWIPDADFVGDIYASF